MIIMLGLIITIRPEIINRTYSNNQEYEQMLSDIEYMAERGASKNEITKYVQEIAKENGFDEQYILDTIMWDKLGKIEGGVK